MDEPSSAPTAATFAPPKSPPQAVARTRIAILGLIGAAAVVAAASFGMRRLEFVLHHEETDDAQVDGDIGPVLPRVSGYVERVLVAENQRVAAGQPLLEIDHRELDLKLANAAAVLQSAQAAVADAEAAVSSARAAERVAQANIGTASAAARKISSDAARDTRLFETNAITDLQLTDSRADDDIARARLEAARRQDGAAATEIAVAEARVKAARAQVEERQADLDYARLQRSYATVTAPISGFVSHKNVEPGQFVQAGQTLLSVVSGSNLWVIANFKETQLARMAPGQPAEVTVDSYPGIVFEGRVQSLAGATGARFALLPPDNASGNFVKVTQRVPVKIALPEANDSAHALRPGMSVDAAVRVRD